MMGEDEQGMKQQSIKRLEGTDLAWVDIDHHALTQNETFSVSPGRPIGSYNSR